MSGLLELTPWARGSLLAGDIPAIRQRIPPDATLWLSVSTHNHRQYLGRLTTPDGSVDARGTLAQVLDALLGPEA